MKGLFYASLVGAGLGVVVFHPGSLQYLTVPLENVVNLYTGIYPEDTAKHEALELCFQQDPNFDRLVAAQRQACYQKLLGSAQVAPARPDERALGIQAANFVDLWKAAGSGYMPNHDIRAQEETQKFLHPAVTPGKP